MSMDNSLFDTSMCGRIIRRNHLRKIGRVLVLLWLTKLQCTDNICGCLLNLLFSSFLLLFTFGNCFFISEKLLLELIFDSLYDANCQSGRLYISCPNI